MSLSLTNHTFPDRSRLLAFHRKPFILISSLHNCLLHNTLPSLPKQTHIRYVYVIITTIFQLLLSCYWFILYPVAFSKRLCFFLNLLGEHNSENKPFKTKHSVFFQQPPLQSLPGGSQRDSDYNQGTAAPAMPINVGGLKMEQRERGEKCLCLHLHTLPYWTGCWGVSAQLVALQQTLQGHVAPARRTPTQTCLHKLSSSL